MNKIRLPENLKTLSYHVLAIAVIWDFIARPVLAAFFPAFASVPSLYAELSTLILNME